MFCKQSSARTTCTSRRTFLFIFFGREGYGLHRVPTRMRNGYLFSFNSTLWEKLQIFQIRYAKQVTISITYAIAQGLSIEPPLFLSFSLHLYI